MSIGDRDRFNNKCNLVLKLVSEQILKVNYLKKLDQIGSADHKSVHFCQHGDYIFLCLNSNLK